MITKIGLNLDRKFYINTSSKKQQNSTSNPINKEINWSYYLPFTGSKKDKQESKIESIMFNADSTFRRTTEQLELEAKEYGYDSITPMIAYKHLLQETYDYVKDLDSGKRDYKTSSAPALANTMISDYSSNIFSEKEQREKVEPVLKKYIDLSDKKIKAESPNNYKSDTKPVFSKYLADSIWSSRDKKNNSIGGISLVDGVLGDKEGENEELYLNFWFDVCNAIMLNNKSDKERCAISDYDTKANDVLKHIKVGTNMFVTYDFEKEEPQSFIDTIYKNADKSVKIVEFNKDTTSEYFTNMVNKLGKDKNNKYIVIANPTFIASNEPDNDDEDDDWTDNFDAEYEISQAIKKHPVNVSFILYDTKNNYYKKINGYTGFEEAAVPTLSAAQIAKAFVENPNLYKDVKKPFTDKAIEKLAIASDKLEGKFPQKTILLMQKVAAYNEQKALIEESDADEYLKEISYMFKKANNDSSVEIVLDTERKLDDIIGKESTKKEAQNIVNQIITNTLGTKGVIIFSQDGYPGGGRRFTAKAIAGEAKVPYIEINSMDFGTKDVDLFGLGSITPEKSMKKLFSVVTSQAETNPNKSAVLYIENFEYFSLGEVFSNYYQKAMAQLLREMDRAEKDGFNILVVGSVSDPNTVGETAMKSFKFVDQIEVSSTAYNKDERANVILNSIKNMNMKLNGTEEENENLISYVADLTQGFPFIYLKNILKKTQSVAQERNHEFITKADVTEAYLQITTGRPAMRKINEHEKQIVSSHECGHAINLTVMNNIAQTLGNKWHIPDKVNFITLDPRGYYGGAVYHVSDKNKEISFERMFGSLVCTYGGHSCEKYFYGIDGSYGITSDMESAREDAMDMVRTMGMGAKTGKMTIFEDETPSDKTKEMLENDERVILHNAKITSDLITEIYADFNREFTEKYAHKVGTGECIINGDDFRKSLNEWKSRQPLEKQREFELCDKTIIEIMEATKRGVAVIKN